VSLKQSLIVSALKRAGWRSGRRALEQGFPASGDGAAPEHDTMAEMGFLDHLEELRFTIFKAGGAVVATSVVVAFFRRWIIDSVLLGPAKADFFMYRWLGIEAQTLALQNRDIYGQMLADWGTVLAVGLILGSPFVVYYIWKFVEPGLYRDEKRGLRFAAAFATFFFMVGIVFGYCILTPFGLQFFAHYQISEQVVNDFDITRYFSMITWWSFGSGLLFELPVVVYFLARIGLLTDTLMRRYWRQAFIGILVLAAFVTPPEPFSMILVSIPLVGLYELSILIARVVGRRRQRELDAALS
jgi:sec-independent protein translocase protein TatC